MKIPTYEEAALIPPALLNPLQRFVVLQTPQLYPITFTEMLGEMVDYIESQARAEGFEQAKKEAAQMAHQEETTVRRQYKNQEISENSAAVAITAIGIYRDHIRAMQPKAGQG